MVDGNAQFGCYKEAGSKWIGEQYSALHRSLIIMTAPKNNSWIAVQAFKVDLLELQGIVRKIKEATAKLPLPPRENEQNKDALRID